jgi:phosphoribosylformylglycinamidine synthase
MSVKVGGVAEAVALMSFGNNIGFESMNLISDEILYKPGYGCIVAEVTGEIEFPVIGKTTENDFLLLNDKKIFIDDLLKAYTGKLEEVFPTKTIKVELKPIDRIYKTGGPKLYPRGIAKPKVVIPVFPGTNCEYDSSRAFEKAGASTETLIFRNLNPSDVHDSVERLKYLVDRCNILMIPGGFSAGDEPEGSGKFIANVFRNKYLEEAVMKLLNQRDGLVLGICNGFQALVKLGLLPYGEIRPMEENSPTLTFNEIGRHVSCMVNTRISSDLSPWLSLVETGDIHTIPVSHGEGRFVADEMHFEQMFKNGQIATQYVDDDGIPTYDNRFNPNGSMHAVEGITSPDGRVFGKMGHSERIGENVCINVPGSKNQRIFESGVKYFR